MKTVYIYGSPKGILWVEDSPTTTMSTAASEWRSGVQFQQHPKSEKDVFVDASGGRVQFSLDQSDSPLKAKAVEMTPDDQHSVFLVSDEDDSSDSSDARLRWHSGYVQRK